MKEGFCKGFLFQKDNVKKAVYFLCFLVMSFCDQQIGSASNEMQLVCPNLVFCCLSCIALSHYPLSSYRKPLFQILFLLCAAGTILVCCLRWPGTPYHFQLISGGIAAVLYCCVLIQTGIALFIRRKIPGGRCPGTWLFSLLLLLILLSRYDNYNGPLLCLSVLLIYLTEFTTKELDGMLKALGGALIAAFFIIQGMAFLFRPYDTLRYLGMYANTNMNALFYLLVYCVFLAGFCKLEIGKTHPVLRWVSFCFACAMWSFVLLTVCRSALLAMAAATLLGLGITVKKQYGRRLRKALLYFASFLAVTSFSFPIVYGAVRYLPPVFHHPIWFVDEYSEEKVHSWDTWDSEKYTDWRDVLQENFSRLFDVISLLTSSKADPAPFFLTGEQTLLASAADGVTALVIPENEMPAEGESVGAVHISHRFTIYKHYLSELNLRGHRDSENGVQVNEVYFAPHAHNVLLQYAFNYGLPAGIVFILYLAASGIRYLTVCIKERNSTELLTGLLLFVGIGVFGMLEQIFRYGQFSHTLLLLLPCFVWRHKAAVFADGEGSSRNREAAGRIFGKRSL